MRRLLLFLASLAAVVTGCALVAGCASGSSGAPTPALVDIGAGLTGRPGLTATVYASGVPDVAALAVDGRGRLWVASAAF